MITFLKWILVLFAIVSTVVLGGVGLVFVSPETMVNNQTLNYVKNNFLSNVVNWKNIDIAIHSKSVWSKAISLYIEDLELTTETINLSMPEAFLKTDLQVAPWSFQVDSIGPITLKQMTVKVMPSVTPPPTAVDQADPFDINSYISMLNDIVIKKIDVTADSIEIVSDKQVTEFNGRLSLSGLHESNKDHLKLELFGIKGSYVNKLDVSATLDGYDSILDPNSTVQLFANLSLTSGDSTLTGTLFPGEKQRRSFIIGGKASADKAHVAFDVNGTIEPHKLVSFLSLEAKGLADQLPTLKLEPCQLDGSWGDLIQNDLTLKLDCEAGASRLNNIQEDLVGIFAPNDLRLKILSELTLKNSGASKLITTDTTLTINQTHDELVDLKGNVRVSGEFDTAAEHSIDELALTLDLAARIDSFKKIVTRLKGTGLEVPAPANQLEGPVACGVKGKFSVNDLKGRFPFDCKFDLKSTKQRLLADTTGSLSIKPTKSGPVPVLDLDVTVDGIELMLPSLELTSDIPRLTPDSRIVLNSEEKSRAPGLKKSAKLKQHQKSQPTNFVYGIRIRSKKTDSILIHSNLAKEPIPVSVNAVIKSESPVTGFIAVDNFKVSLLRRQAEVLRFRVALSEDPNDQILDGLVRFDNNDYTIDLKIFGNAAAPKYLFESDPPLSQSDLMAVLLFGKSPDALDSDKLKTVDDTRAAIADGAVNLLSMYYLAATPVESVGYNPQSGVFSAKVNLQKGLSLTVGTDTNAQKEVGLRKRLGAGWSVETTAIRNDDSNAKKGIAMLRWGKRY